MSIEAYRTIIIVDFESIIRITFLRKSQITLLRFALSTARKEIDFVKT